MRAQAAVRDRPDARELPQRDHARAIRLPDARVRADGDGVLLPAAEGPREPGRVPRAAPGVDRRAPALVPRRARHRSLRACASATTRRRSSRTTAPARPTSSTSSPGAGASWRASPRRTDFDLTPHGKVSGHPLTYFDEETQRAHRALGHRARGRLTARSPSCLLDAYNEEPDEKGDQRVVLKFKPAIAPIKVAVLPLSKNDALRPIARARLRHAAAALDDAVRRDAGDRPALPAPGRDRHAALRHRRLQIRWRRWRRRATTRSPSANATAQPQVRVPISGLVDALQERLPRC